VGCDAVSFGVLKCVLLGVTVCLVGCDGVACWV